jgi:acyl-CoA reductase-like NAD-dependent aldehyde dehydrogenase
MSRITVFKTYKNFVNGEFARSESGRYYKVNDSKGAFLADVCLSSRKDAKAAVVAARNAFSGWAGKSAYNRGQIIYRIAEMLESRKAQFIEELISMGFKPADASAEVTSAIETFVYYAGWTDKYIQVFSSVNPVASKHFNFSVPEPTGIVATYAPEKSPLAAFVRQIAPVITGGNVVIAIPSETAPLPALSLGEVLASSDVPHGVVNIMSGTHKELIPVLASHMDVNAIQLCGDVSKDLVVAAAESASLNLKRFSTFDAAAEDNPYAIMEFTEIKTTWHPVGF